MNLKIDDIQQHLNSDSLTLVFVLLIIGGAPILITLDSPLLLPYFSYGQMLANMIMLATYGLLLLLANGKLFRLVLLMTFYSFFAEIIGSILLGLYQYRLKNIPLYIPFGHGLLYATVYLAVRHPWLRKHSQYVRRCLTKAAFIVSIMSLIVLNDIFGFGCYLLFLFISHFRKQRIFYVAMFMLVYYIELIGTSVHTWSWYGQLATHPCFPSIGATPSGVAGLYLLIDLTCNSVYFYVLKLFRRFSLPTFKIRKSDLPYAIPRPRMSIHNKL